MAKKKKDNLLPLEGYINQNVEIPKESLPNPNLFTQVQSVLTYNYGEDIAKWGAIEPFTLNHKQTNSILAMFDGNADTFYELENATAPSATTTIIFDFGKTLQIRGFIVAFFFTSGSAATKTFTSSYSTDGLNYQTIATTTSGTADEYHDHVATNLLVRKIKLTFTSENLGSAIKLFQFSTIV